MPKRVFFLLIGLVILLLVSSPLAEAANDYIIELPDEKIVLTAPIKILWIDMARDGGTIGVTLLDSKGVNFEFCFDGRMQTVEDYTPPHVFLKAIHPSLEGALAVPVGGAEERVLQSLMEDWFAANYSEEDKAQLFDSPNMDFPGGPEEKLKAYRVFQLLELFKNRRN